MTMVPAAASVLCAELIDGPRQRLYVAHRGSRACQLADRDHRVVLCVIAPTAVRLPYAVVVASLPSGSSSVSVGGGSLGWDGDTASIRRWWTPARPSHPSLLAAVNDAQVDAFAAQWRADLGRGDGLTPYSDDVLCGALIALRAAGHPRARRLAAEVAQADLESATTATSAALLRQAARGWCIDALAGYLVALAQAMQPPSSRSGDTWSAIKESPAPRGIPAPQGYRATDSTPEPDCDRANCRRAARDLLAVGSSSGRGLLEGVHRVLAHPTPDDGVTAA